MSRNWGSNQGSFDSWWEAQATDVAEDSQVLRSTPSVQSSPSASCGKTSSQAVDAGFALQGGSYDQPAEENPLERSAERQRLRSLQERAAKLHAIKDHLQRISRQRRQAADEKSGEALSGAQSFTESREPAPRATRWRKTAELCLSWA